MSSGQERVYPGPVLAMAAPVSSVGSAVIAGILGGLLVGACGRIDTLAVTVDGGAGGASAGDAGPAMRGPRPKPGGGDAGGAGGAGGVGGSDDGGGGSTDGAG